MITLIRCQHITGRLPLRTLHRILPQSALQRSRYDRDHGPWTSPEQLVLLMERRPGALRDSLQRDLL